MALHFVFLILAGVAFGTSLFEYERQQLTSKLLGNLSRPESALFSSEQSHDDDTTFAGRGDCKVFPGDEAWPSPELWDTLSSLTGSRLLKPVPAAHVCYSNTTEDIAACTVLTDTWSSPYSHLSDPIEMFCGSCEDLTCQPPSIFDSGTCTQGGYPVYTVNVSTVAHIQLAVNFAHSTGIRLVIKNTGHDFGGKSGGAGSLSIWTHWLKDILYIPDFNASNSEYSGPAFKLGAGVHVFEAYAAAHAQGLVVVGGECPTVGIVGGYVQGAGHSPLSSVLGMAADHVLAFEVVLATGEFVSANAHENADLFWALRGGGGGTYGVVTSMIVKAHTDMPVSTSSFTYTTGTGISRESFWTGFKAFFDSFPQFAAEGIYAYFFIWPDLPVAGELLFTMQPFFAPNKTSSELANLLKPWFSELQTLGISINTTISHFSNFYEAWNSSFNPEGLLPPYATVASRLWPEQNWNDDTIINATFAEVKTTVEDGHYTFGYNIAGRWAHQGDDDNAVNPAWRKTVSHMMSGVTWPLNASSDEQLAIRKNFTYGHMQKWRDLSRGAGAYLNEADRIEPGFQWSFYGDKYPRLLELKRKYDSRNVLWAATAVGSEFFEVRTVDGRPNENGRLCKKAQPDLYTPQA